MKLRSFESRYRFIFRRRRTALILALALALCVFPGCGEKSDSVSVIMAAPPASDTLLVPGGAAESAVPQSAAPGAQGVDMKTEDTAMKLSYAARSLAAGYAGNENGCYSLLSYTDGSADLVYADYGALEMDVLPAVAGGGGTRGGLSAFYGGATPVWAGSNLFLFKQRASAGFLAGGGDEAHAAVLRFGPDGSGPAACVFEEELNIRPSGAVLWDGIFLYFIAERQRDEGPVQVLVRLEAAGMVLTELHSLEPGFDYTIEGYWQMGPVICAAGALPPTEDPAFNEAWNTRGYTLFALGMASGRRKELVAWQQGSPAVMLGDTFYTFSADDDSLYALSANSGEKAAIGAGFAPQEYSTAQMLPVLDGKLRLQFSGNLGYEITDYVIDPATGEVSRPEARGFGNNVSVLAENTDYFFVHNGDGFVRREAVDPGFVPTSGLAYSELFVSVPAYALITKADYWAGAQNFTGITSLLYEGPA